MADQIGIAGSGYGNAYVDSLITGYAWSGNPVRVAFAEGAVRPGSDGGYGVSWDTVHEQAFIRVMASYEAVCNIDFQITGDYDRADILWYQLPTYIINNDRDDSIIAAADHGYPDGDGQVFGRFRYDMNSWFDVRPGGQFYDTIIHELGHGLGLAHPHLDGTDPTTHTAFPGVDASDDTGTNGLNQSIWTVMSYNDGWDTVGGWSLDRGHTMTPMAFDVAALQRMYGANTTYHTGDDNYSVGPYWDTAGTGWSCIWDAGGSDTISAVGATENVHIELRAATLVDGDANAGGFASYYFEGGLFGTPRGYPVAGGLTIANGVVLENAIGGQGNDELIGNQAHNQLTGGQGADLLDGREGYDTAIYNNAHYGEVQVIDMLTPFAGTLDAMGDAFISIEAISGSPTSDHILGTYGADALYGNGGADILQGRWGADILDGGEGIDIAEYGTNVTVDMMFGYLNTGEAAGDSLINIEGLAGSELADDLRGDGQDNHLAGNGGNDWLRGRGGNDSIEGGAGRDTLWGDQGSDLLDGGRDADTMYGGQGDDMYIVDDADDQVIEYANEGYDTIVPLFDFTLTENSYVERIEADSANITITGNSLANDIFGGFGDNRLFGMGGNDTLDGWVGSDWIDGGEGDDVIMVGNQRGHDTYIGGEGSDTLAFRYEFDTGITFDLTWGGPVPFWGTIPYVGYGVIGSITWSGIENVRGTTGDDTLYGDAGNNRLEGGTAGNDTLYGRAGNDMLVGGLGFDTLDGGEGDDTLVGNYEYSVYGVDVMYGGAGSDTADFSNHGYAVWIDLTYAGREVWTTDRFNVFGGAWRQVADLDSVENLIGSASSDRMWGNAEANRIDGGAGRDEIYGRDGDDVLTGGVGFDTLDGGEGNDTLDGGEGDDLAVYSGTRADFSVTDLGDGTYRISDLREGAPEGADQLSGIETIQFTDGTFAIADIANAAPTDLALSNAAIDENSAIGTVVGTLAAADPDLNETFTYQLLDDAGGRFALDGANVIVAGDLDFETATTHDVTVRVTDSGGLVYDKTIAIAVNDILENAAPIDLALSNAVVDENSAIGTVVGTLMASDPDAGETFTYQLLDDAGGRFALDGANVMVAGDLDFEAATTHDVTVRVTDGGGLAYDKTIAIAVNDILENTAPTDLALSNAAIDENSAIGTVVGTLSAADPDLNETFTYQLLDDAGGRFALDGGDVVVADDLDFETATEHQVTVRVTDSGGLFYDETIAIAVNDILEGAVITGTAGNDIVGGTTSSAGLARSTEADDVISGLGGNDVLYGEGGDDVIDGGTGSDTLNGGTGDDVMSGGTGNDTYYVDSSGDKVIEYAGAGVDKVVSTVSITLGANVENLQLTGLANINGTGNALANTLTGNSGNNVLNGGAGADQMSGGGGNDTYYVDSSADKVIENAGAGIDKVVSKVSFTLAANVENLQLIGTASISGTGNTLANTLTGNSGNNVLYGLQGNDTLTGGGGADSFVFNTALNPMTNVDHITDFSVPNDTIWLDDAVFTALSPTGILAASAFAIGTAAADASDRIIYNPTSGALLYDADGTGVRAAALFATLDPGLMLSNTDFHIV